MSERVLLLDTDEPSLERIAFGLKCYGFEVVCATCLDTGLRLLSEESFDAVLVEQFWSGDRTGLEVCQHLRSMESTIPVIVHTRKSKSAHLDEATSFEKGADDWVPKSAKTANLALRIRTRVRRRKTRLSEPFSLSLEKLQATISGKEVFLTQAEAKLLLVLSKQPGRIFSNTELLEKAWGRGYPGSERALRSTVRRLRMKLEERPKSPKYLQNVHGEGYRFIPPSLTS